MSMDETLREQWLNVRDRLQAKQLLSLPEPTLSVRIPGSNEIWFGTALDTTPKRIAVLDTAELPPSADLHAAIYGLRGDVGAIATGGGEFGGCLADFGGVMPGVFDEQVRHLGKMGLVADQLESLAESLRAGGNVFLANRHPVCLGVTGSRLALNAELFEKCAKAYVLAVATGGTVKPLPWIVRYVANERLMKDERRAKERFRQGLLPVESRGY